MQAAAMQIIYKGVFQWFLKLIVGVQFTDCRFLKKEKQFIILANHNSHLDALSLLASLPGELLWKVKPVAAEDYFGKTRFQASISNFFINTLLIRRKGEKDSEHDPIRKMLEAIDAGYSLILFPEGFKAMVPAILILTFAWTLKAMTDSLGAAEYVANVMQSAAGGLLNFLPAIIFLVGCFLAFATGTSWGTFGILIPIVVAVFQGTNETMMIISISACMAGAVCGDHCSPISDTTIMASAGAQCNHVNHVTTQLPYAATVAVVSCITYVIAGFVQNALICLPIGMVLLVAALLFMKKRTESHS